ncbi:hypothetical protein [Lacticaseibacillus paracasei]|uniref:Uncharacterized protein n=1 Tax=Lacticaseibacillus paracasei TaxID=1597 RepID=A0A8B3GR72_LACPA|nr:hypothetical protein [Lacticaseibacillus paracasei]MBM6414004.1 hypothetical protein [Lacticaseibacillus paracasei]RNE28554.1 hypothetical protein FAM6012_02256 [Lacticaseibacillus paracasei]
MLIKLDSGDYVNTDYIERLWMINEHDGFIRFVNTPDVPISKNDRGLILKAMAFSPLINGEKVTDNAD